MFNVTFYLKKKEHKSISTQPCFQNEKTKKVYILCN